ncbi:MAG: UDP-N-acetylmuramate dehydrogenase [Prevotellaceae bacterium]|jgi:UDP-N-acetylmuramate dehydrogenase|nr:UDP-N-acetylmuramate dehydrogenase [Prevotellaceae bacterium]
MLTIQTNYSLKQLNTFNIDVKAKYYAAPTSEDEILEILNDESLVGVPRFILGGGSNVLFTGDFDGIVIHPQIKGIEKIDEDENHIWLCAGAGVVWDIFVSYCVKNNWGGVENLSFIPGNVGAAPVQNIGAYGVEAKSTIDEVYGIYLENGEPFCLNNAECEFGYRDSVFKEELKGKAIITEVTFKLNKKPVYITHYGNVEEELTKNYSKVNVQNIRKAIITIRERKLPDPGKLPNAGSFFKNPIVPVEFAENLKQKYENMPLFASDKKHAKLAAGWLIEQCGWKGKRIANVGVHEHQALVLINYGGAEASELTKLAADIQQSVKEKFYVEVESEVNYV